MARIKRFAALMLVGILALGILTGCVSAPVQPPIVPSVPSTPSEPEAPEEPGTPTTTPDELGQKLLKEVFELIPYENNDSMINLVKNQLDKIDPETGIFEPSYSQIPTVAYGIYANGNVAINVTQENYDSILKNIIANGSYSGFSAFGVYYRVAGDNLYVGWACTVPMSM